MAAHRCETHRPPSVRLRGPEAHTASTKPMDRAMNYPGRDDDPAGRESRRSLRRNGHRSHDGTRATTERPNNGRRREGRRSVMLGTSSRWDSGASTARDASNLCAENVAAVKSPGSSFGSALRVWKRDGSGETELRRATGG